QLRAALHFRIVRGEGPRFFEILERVIPAMKAPPAERPIYSRDSIFLDAEERAPGRLFFRPEMVTLFEPRDLLPDTGIFRIGLGHFFPGCHSPGIVVFRSRVISSVLIELQR